MRKAFAEYKKSIKDEGHREGHREGHKEGLLEGLLEGVEKRNNEIVTNMLMEQIPIVKIEKWTRLSQDQILQIAKVNNIPLP